VQDAQVTGRKRRQDISLKGEGFVFKIQLDTDEQYTKWMAVLEQAVVWKLETFYEVGVPLGVGQYAKVTAGRCLKTGLSVAIKTIERRSEDKSNAKFVEREDAIMRVVNHDNIVRA